MTILGRGRRVRFVAWSFAGLTVLVLAAALVLPGFDARVMTASRAGVYGFAAAGCLVYAGIGGLLAARVPRNAIGWLLGLTGFWLAANMLVEQYGLYGLATVPGSLPAVRTVAALGNSANNLVVASLIPVVLLFPTGRLLSKWWRPALWASVWVIVVGGLAQTLQRGTMVAGGLTNALQTASRTASQRWAAASTSPRLPVTAPGSPAGCPPRPAARYPSRPVPRCRPSRGGSRA